MENFSMDVLSLILMFFFACGALAASISVGIVIPSKVQIMFTVVALGPVTFKTNGTGSQLTTVNKNRIIPGLSIYINKLLA